MKEECQRCEVQYSCLYLQNRFEVKACNYDRIQVEMVHNSELERRYRILRGVKNIWI